MRQRMKAFGERVGNAAIKSKSRTKRRIYRWIFWRISNTYHFTGKMVEYAAVMALQKKGVIPYGGTEE